MITIMRRQRSEAPLGGRHDDEELLAQGTSGVPQVTA
jgi:hypothetical protein